MEVRSKNWAGDGARCAGGGVGMVALRAGARGLSCGRCGRLARGFVEGDGETNAECEMRKRGTGKLEVKNWAGDGTMEVHHGGAETRRSG
ncbi:MAG TPA: hypothetical protein VGN88_00635, partial [Phycisphaerae bacterium]